MFRLLFLYCALLYSSNLFASNLFVSTAFDTQDFDRNLTKLSDDAAKVDLLNHQARRLINEQAQRSIKYNMDALSLAEQIGYVQGIAEARRNLGVSYFLSGKQTQALAFIDSALALALQHELKELEARSLWALGYYQLYYEGGEKATSTLLKAASLFATHKNEYWLAKTYIVLGWANINNPDNDDAEVEAYFEQALKLTENNQFNYLIPFALRSLSAYYSLRQTSFYKANSLLERALTLAQQNQQQYEMGKIRQSLGRLYADSNQYDVAKTHYLDALTNFKGIENFHNMSWLYNNLTRIAILQKDYDGALEFNRLAESINEKTTFPLRGMLFIHRYRGTVLRERDKDYAQALTHYFKALEAANDAGLVPPKMKIHVKIGETYLLSKDYANAVQWCEKGLSTAGVYKDFAVLANACLSSAHQNLGQFELALLHQQQLASLKDEIHQEELFVKETNLELQEQHRTELATIEHEQAIEKEKNNTRITITIATIVIIFLIIIKFIRVANVKRAAQQNKLLAQNKFRKELIENVAHDLRTPIAVMQGYAETLLINSQAATVQEQEKYLHSILNGSKKLTGLIAQLFEFSKLESDEVKLHKQPVQIAELIHCYIEDYHVLADKKHVELEMHCPSTPPVINADSSLVERVIQNLLDNALKYTPEDGKICINVKHCDKLVRISILDTGQGISEERQQAIFSRHEKSKDSMGAGLGLAIVKKIVELHKGDISVKSKLGQGTEFVFSLPIH